MISESAARTELVELGRALYDRGVTHGRTGNVSQIIGDRVLMTPTGGCLGRLRTDQLSVLDREGNHVDGPAPSKEIVLHLALYRRRPQVAAVAHVHSTHAVAWSCMDGLDPTDALPPLTAYYAMRVGRLPLIGYFAPGSPHLADAVEAVDSDCALLAHHGSIAAAQTLEAAVDAVEEIEETARIALLLHTADHHGLTTRQVAEIRTTHS